MSDDTKPWDKITLPTDEQRERSRAIINKALGYDFFDSIRPVSADAMLMVVLIVHLNKDKILGFGHE